MKPEPQQCLKFQDENTVDCTQDKPLKKNISQQDDSTEKNKLNISILSKASDDEKDNFYELYEMQRKQNQELKVEINELKIKLKFSKEHFKELLDDAQRKRDQIRFQSLIKNKDLTEKISKLSYMNENNSEVLTNLIKEQSNLMKQKQEKLREKQREIEKLTKQTMQLKDLNIQNKKLIYQTDQKIKNNEKSVTEKTQQIAQLNKQLSDRAAEVQKNAQILKQVFSNCRAKDGEIEKMKLQITESKGKQDLSQKAAAEAKAKLQNAEKSVTEKTQQIATLNKQLSDRAAEVQKNAQILKQVFSNCRAKDGDISKFKLEISQLKSKLDQQLRKVSEQPSQKLPIAEKSNPLQNRQSVKQNQQSNDHAQKPQTIKQIKK